MNVKNQIDNFEEVESFFSTLSSKNINEIKQFFKILSLKFNDSEFDIIKKHVFNDERSGVASVFKGYSKRRNTYLDELSRVEKMYSFQETIGSKPGESVILGLDEVGRGPLAGPLTVGGVILDSRHKILMLNDSKQLNPDKRNLVFQDIIKYACAYNVFSVPPRYIDKFGMTECLKRAFRTIINKIESQGYNIDVILLDGNPLHIDPREINIVKGDAKCASIAAASIIAKVERDAYMVSISEEFPNYDFASNKGYGTKKHIDAIKKFGLCSIHRKSFCSSFMQMSLF